MYCVEIIVILKVYKQMAIDISEDIFASATSTGGLAAVILNWLLPHNINVGEKSIEPDV